MSSQHRLSDYSLTFSAVSEFVGMLRAEIGVDLTVDQLRILLEIMSVEAAGTEVTMRQLAQQLSIKPHTISRSISLLGASAAPRAGLGLVESHPDPNDRRSRKLHLTKKGAALSVEVGEQIRKAALERFERIEFVDGEGEELVVEAGIDVEAKVCVYVIRGAFATHSYEKIHQKMLDYPSFNRLYHEVFDLTQATEYGSEPALVENAVSFWKQQPQFHQRKTCYLSQDARILSQLELIRARFEEVGLQMNVVCRSMEDVRRDLCLGSEWTYPPRRLLF